MIGLLCRFMVSILNEAEINPFWKQLSAEYNTLARLCGSLGKNQSCVSLYFLFQQNYLTTFSKTTLPERINLSRNSNLRCLFTLLSTIFYITQKQVKRLGACLRKPVFLTSFIFYTIIVTVFLQTYGIVQDEKVQPCKL